MPQHTGENMTPKMRMYAALVYVCATTGLWAQQKGGDWEVQLQGSYFTLVGTDVTNNVGTISGKVGPFLTDNIQVGVGPTMTIATTSTTAVPAGGGAATTSSSTRVTFGSTAWAVYSVLLHDARTAPYVGACWYKRDFSNGSDNGWVGINGGAKFYYTRRAAVDVSANYLRSLNKGTEGGMLLFAFGLSFLL
jgi:hypothetical protein